MTSLAALSGFLLSHIYVLLWHDSCTQPSLCLYPFTLRSFYEGITVTEKLFGGHFFEILWPHPFHFIAVYYSTLQFCYNVANFIRILPTETPSLLRVWDMFYMITSVMTWKHFSHYWSFVRGNHWSPLDSPHKGLIIWSFEVFFVNELWTVNEHLIWWWFEMP